MSESAPSRRRFLPEPVETFAMSHKRSPSQQAEMSNGGGKAGHEAEGASASGNADTPPRKRLLPQPIETSKSSRHAAKPSLPTPESSPGTPPPASAESTPKQRRKFTPQLIETSKRSKRAGDSRPATLPTDKTDITPGTNHIYMPRRKAKQRPLAVPLVVPDNTPAPSVEQITQYHPMPPHRQGSMRPHLNTRRPTRQDSYQPALEPIVSEDNSSRSDIGNNEDYEDHEGTPSLSGSYGSSDDSQMRMQMARTRESCDDRFSGYLLELAAKAAEKQLREQALAAFPNSDVHEIVEHFYDREEAPSDEEEVIGVGLLPHEILSRRESMEVGWAAREMQAHQESLAKMREEETNLKLAAEASHPTFKDPFWTNGMTAKVPQTVPAKEAELQAMRSAASPPMLGDDLKFRMCPSPKATKFESDQEINVTPKHRDDGGGLWGGYCVADEEEQYLSPLARRPSLIATPDVERDDPFASAFVQEIPKTQMKRGSRPLPAAKAGVQMISGIDERLKEAANKSKLQTSLQKEFDDKFVTQVFNYLSLGYPSLARLYDEELSKITKVPVSELCKDDQLNNAQGHIEIGSNGETSDQAVVHCTRWEALRLYILEWAKQNPTTDDVTSLGAWGVRARRGSWAF
ncbi:MAG: hypothetical protein M1818_000773 [Claussenomyces sp. TS43310]|nr:MAG: hypothetical protein M1818_000773 [Claussenomyces sp. TS43310]